MTNRKATKKSAPDGNAAGGALQPAASPAPSGTASAPGEAADDGSSAAAVGAAAAHPGAQLSAHIVYTPSSELEPAQTVFEKVGVIDTIQVIEDATIEPEAAGRYLKVVGPQTGRWRAGRHFGPVARYVLMDWLTPEQISAIEGDPMLLCTVVSDPDELG